MALGILPGMNQRLLVHTWSLASEWQYYLIWPLLFIVLLRSRLSRSSLALLIAAVALASGVWRTVLWNMTGDLPRVQYALDTRSDGLLAGTAVALLFSNPAIVDRLRSWRHVRPATWLAFLATLGLLASGAPLPFFLWGGETALVAGAALLLCGLLLDPPRGVVRILASPLLAWIGKISYGLYLWHLPIHGYLQSVRGLQGIALILATLALTFAAASASYYLIEQPLLRLKVQFGALAQRAGPSSPISSSSAAAPGASLRG
jgi:peptidoglycan/LPS O-acetylase OafA/YrhL